MCKPFFFVDGGGGVDELRLVQYKNKLGKKRRPINNFFLHFLFFYCFAASTRSLSLLPRLFDVTAHGVSVFSLFFPVEVSLFFSPLLRLKLRLMTNFVKLVLKCYQLMAILNKSNYYYQQQNGKVCAWMKRCATHCRCRWLRCLQHWVLCSFGSFDVSTKAQTRRRRKKKKKNEKGRRLVAGNRAVKIGMVGGNEMPSSVFVSFECKLLPIFHRR